MSPHFIVINHQSIVCQNLKTIIHCCWYARPLRQDHNMNFLAQVFSLQWSRNSKSSKRLMFLGFLEFGRLFIHLTQLFSTIRQYKNGNIWTFSQNHSIICCTEIFEGWEMVGLKVHFIIVYHRAYVSLNGVYEQFCHLFFKKTERRKKQMSSVCFRQLRGGQVRILGTEDV